MHADVFIFYFGLVSNNIRLNRGRESTASVGMAPAQPLFLYDRAAVVQTGNSVLPEDENDAKRVASVSAPSLWSIIPLIGITIFVIGDMSVPGRRRWTYVADLPCFVFGVYLIVDYVFRFLGRPGTTKKVASESRPSSGRRMWRWFILPICGFVLISFVFWNWPLQIRFALCQSALEAEHQRIESGGAVSDHWKRVGLFSVWPRRLGGRTVFFTGGGHPSSMSGYGLVKGKLKSPTLRSLDRVWGDWYVLHGSPFERPTSLPAIRGGERDDDDGERDDDDNGG